MKRLMTHLGRGPSHCRLLAAAVLACISTAAFPQAPSYTELNTADTVAWNSAGWTAGVPSSATAVGLLHGNGTVVIDAASTDTTPAGLLVGWNTSSFTVDVTGGSLTVGSTVGTGTPVTPFGLTLGESPLRTGTLNQSGGTVTAPLVRSNNGTGVYNLNGGTLQTAQFFRRFTNPLTLNFGGGTLEATGTSEPGLTGSGVSIVVNAGGGTIDNGGFAVNMNGTISGSGPLSLTGGGTTTYLANNTHTGTTTLSGGTLRIGDGGTIGGNAGSLVNNTAVIFDRSSDLTYAGVISGSGTVTKRNANTLVLSPANTYAGLTIVEAGTLQNGINSASSIVGGSYDVESGAKLVFSRNLNATKFSSQSISGDGDLEFQGQAAGFFTFRPDYTGTLSYAGQTIVNLTTDPSADWFRNALWLEKDNVLPGATVVNLQSGKIYLRAQTGTGISVAGLTGNAGTFITTDRTVAQGIQKWTVTVASETSHTYAGVIGADGTGTGTDSVSFTKAGPGTQILTGSNTYAGSTSITGGKLVIASTGLINQTSGITINGAGAELAYNSSTALTRPLTFTQGTISGTGTIGTAVVVGANAILSPGNSPGAQAYSSGLTWNPEGTYTWEINDATGAAGTNWDVLNVSGGALDLSGLSVGNTFNLDLTTLTVSASGPMANYVDGQAYTFSLATYASLSLPVGFSGNDLTSLFTLSFDNWANPVPSLANVSIVNNSATSTINLVVVPEPSTLALAVMALAAAGWKLRRRRTAR
jgi:fibronectin-binding autotransporter adhesin